MEILEGRLVPALDISLSSSSFAQGLLGGESVGTLSVTGNTTQQKYSFIFAQGTGDTDNSRFQIRENMLEIAPTPPFGNAFTAGATYSVLIQATGTTAGDIVLKSIQLTAKADLLVNLAGDVTDPNDGKLSLREAFAIANADPDHDRIVFDATQVGPDVNLSTVGATIQGPAALLVSAPVSVDGGQGHKRISLSATAPEARLFTVSPSGNLRLEKIDLQGGLARGVSGNPEGRGGAVLALGPFSLFSGSIVGAKAVGFAGGVQPGGAKGGAIYAESDLHLFQATISGNVAEGGSGTTSTGQPITGPSAGGGIFVSSPAGNHFAILELSTIADNSANTGAGMAVLPPTSAAGGAGASLRVDISGSVLADNKGGGDAEVVPGGSTQFVNFTVNQSFAETLGQFLSGAGFTIGETGLGPRSSASASPVHRPTDGSPLIGAVTSNTSFIDPTGAQRFQPTAAGAAEYYTPPDDISLSNNSFPAAFPAGASIGKLSASGIFAGFSFDFALVPGVLDNARFQVQGNDLRTASGTSFTPGATYSVRIRATGVTGLSFEKELSVLAKADIVVDTAADIVNPSDGKTSLREAIAAAALSPGPDNISFDPGLAGATLSVGEDPNLPGTAFFVTSEIQISGENSPGLVIRPEAGKNIRLFQVAYATPLGLREITLAGGRAIDGPGGAILASIGKVYLDAVTLTDNSSSGSGAGGGAVAVSGGRLAIRNSTFFNNRVESATGQGAGAGEGGHILVKVGSLGPGDFTYGGGPGPIGPSEPALTIIGGTFSDGTATGGTGGVALVSSLAVAPTAEIRGSVFANSTGNDLSSSASGSGLPFAITGGGNFVGNGQGLPSGLVTATGDAKLGPLADNGGATFTMAPQPGSPLLVPTDPAQGLAKDQRGVTRALPFTIGAFQAVRATALSIFPSTGPVGVGGAIDFVVAFSHPVKVVGTPGLALNIPGVRAMALSAAVPSSVITFRYTVQPGNLSQGISVASGANLDFTTGTLRDMAGGVILGRVPEPAIPGPAVDGVAPSPFVGFSSPLPANPSNAPGFASFASFGESGLVGTLTPNDFNLVNATVSTISGPDASGKYTFVITPISDGNVRFSLKSGALADAAGNPSQATQSVAIISDRTRPETTLTLSPAPGAASAAGTLAGEVRFSEPVSGLSEAGFAASGAAVTQLAGPDTEGVYSFILVPEAGSQVFLSVKAGAAIDVAGNPSKASPTISFFSDQNGPAFTVVSPPAVQPSQDGGKSLTVSLRFTDPSGVDPQSVDGDAVELTGPYGEPIPMVLDSFNGLVAVFSAELGGSPVPGAYSVAFTGTVADSLGNTAIPSAIGTVFINTADTMPPEVLSITRGGEPIESFRTSQFFLVNFSEPVIGLSAASFLTFADDGLDATIRRVTLPDGRPLGVAPVTMVRVEVVSNGLGLLTLDASPESGVTDAAGNALAPASESIQPESYLVDTTPVGVLSLGPVDSPRSTPVDSIDIELSKPAMSAAQIRGALLMLRNGKRFPLDSEFTISQTGYSSYRIDHFATQSGVAGEYALVLDAGLLTDPAGRPGTGAEMVSWSAVSPITTGSFNPVFAPPSTGVPDPFVIGVSKRVLLGIFSDSSGGLDSDYTARVNWGDGGGSIPFSQLENAEIVPSDTPGVFAVFGTHTYNLDRNYLINVLVRDSASGTGGLLGLIESSAVVVTPLQSSQLLNKQFVRGDTQTAALTAGLQPQGAPRPLLQVVFAQPPAVTGAERTIYLANYASNPESGSVPVAPANISSVTWLDLRASGVVPSAGSLFSQFAFSANSTQGVSLFYFDSATGAYLPVLSSGGVVPLVDRVTGLVVVTFDNTSTPKLANLNETVFAVAVTAASAPAETSPAGGSVAASGAVTATFNSTLVQASQALTQQERSGRAASDASSGGLASGLFVGGRSSTLALSPSSLGTGAPARMRASAGTRLAMASSRDAAMALGGLLRGAMAPVERKLKPLMEALGITDQDTPQNGPAIPPAPPKPANPDQPRGASSGATENPPMGAPSPSVRLNDNHRALDEALAIDAEDHAIGPWAVGAAVLLAVVHIRPVRDPRRTEEDQRASASCSD